MTTTLSIDVRPAGPRIGAEIHGVDLTRDVDEAIADELRAAFREHKVLVFRGQHLDPARHVDAVSIFARPFDHPTATKHPDHALVYPYRVEQSGKANAWHVGGVWRDRPFALESLVYEEVAPLGGHTLWADLQDAYDDLSEPVRTLLESVSGEYDSDAVHYAQGADKGRVQQTIEHPVVLRHPETGRPGLFLSTGVRRLTGISAAESAALLPFLLAHASSPDYTIRFSWSPGDFVVWDNLATWHYAIDDYRDGPRAYRKVIGVERT